LDELDDRAAVELDEHVAVDAHVAVDDHAAGEVSHGSLHQNDDECGDHDGLTREFPIAAYVHGCEAPYRPCPN
jgi:hypothetical protein